LHACAKRSRVSWRASACAGVGSSRVRSVSVCMAASVCGKVLCAGVNGMSRVWSNSSPA